MKRQFILLIGCLLAGMLLSGYPALERDNTGYWSQFATTLGASDSAISAGLTFIPEDSLPDPLVRVFTGMQGDETLNAYLITIRYEWQRGMRQLSERQTAAAPEE